MRDFLYNRKEADRIEEGFSLKNRPKRVENKSDWHHARSYHRTRDIRLQLMSVRPFLKNCFPCFFFNGFHRPK